MKLTLVEYVSYAEMLSTSFAEFYICVRFYLVTNASEYVPSQVEY